MKTTFICILLFTITLSSHAQEWNVLNEGMGNFWSIDFVNDNVGWLGGDGILLKTEDGGETWYKISQVDTLNFAHINFYTDSVGWALAGHKLIKTISGGQSWTVQKVFDYSWDNEDINSSPLQVLNDSVVFVIGGYHIDGTDDYMEKVYKTGDGGLNWDAISPDLADKYLRFVCFINENTGFFLCDDNTIFRTTDSGTTWNECPVNLSPYLINLQFVNDSTGYIVTSEQIWTTSDTGRTWSSGTQQNGIIDVFFLDENTVFTITEDTNGFNISKSANGGLDWENTYDLGSIGYVHEMGSQEIYAKLYFTNNTGYLIVDKGGWQLLRSVDRGNTWKFQILNYPFSDVQFFDNDHGLACGGYMNCNLDGYVGDVFRTDDGGQTWDLSHSAEAIFSSLFFVNDYTGFALAELGNKIYKTINRGDDWYLQHSFPDTNLVLNDIFFTDELTGWVCGRFKVWEPEEICGIAILGTNDGGENWKLAWAYPYTSCYIDLSSIYFAGNTGWAVEEYGSGIIVKYTEQEQWQIDTSFTELPLNDVFFSDEEHGWIAGRCESHGIVHSNLFRTKDAGQTWDEIILEYYLINDMYFADSLHGWCIGEDTTGSAMILETFNGGDNWQTVIENLSGSLNAIYFKNGVGWAVGDGLVLRTDNWTTWINPNTGEVYPTKFSLSQNYPNPFNPKTVIRYTVGAQNLVPLQHVDLSVYNILGQKVATLVNKKQPAGSYSIEWDASGYSSGVYLYRISASDFVETKKLVLLK